LISDKAQALVSKTVKDILCSLYISDWQSEPHHQHQKACEQQIQDLKHIPNSILDHTNAPENIWLHCLKYVCFIFNHTASSTLNDSVPLQVLTGSNRRYWSHTVLQVL
jgi:hypothetical protein